MLLCSIFFLLLSNSLSFRRDISIYYSRIGIVIQLYCIYFCYNNLFVSYLDQDVGLFGGLFDISSITLIIHIYIFIYTLLILIIPGFFHKKFFSPRFYLIIKRLNYLFLKLDKNPYISSLTKFLIIVLGIFTLLLFIILIMIISPIIYFLIQYNVIGDNSFGNFNISDSYFENFNIPIISKCQIYCQDIPNTDFSNIPDYIDTTGSTTTDDNYERMVAGTTRDLHNA